MLLESTWIGLVLLDSFIFFRPAQLNALQVFVWLALIAVTLLPSVYLHINHLGYARDRELKVLDDKLTFTLGSEAHSFYWNDIQTIEVHFWKWARAPWRVFDYFVLIGRDHSRMVIPSQLVGYLTFAKLVVTQNKLGVVNPVVVFLKRFPVIRAK